MVAHVIRMAILYLHDFDKFQKKKRNLNFEKSAYAL